MKTEKYFLEQSEKKKRASIVKIVISNLLGMSIIFIYFVYFKKSFNQDFFQFLLIILVTNILTWVFTKEYKHDLYDIVKSKTIFELELFHNQLKTVIEKTKKHIQEEENLKIMEKVSLMDKKR